MKPLIPKMLQTATTEICSVKRKAQQNTCSTVHQLDLSSKKIKISLN